MYSLKLYQVGYTPIFEHENVYLHSSIDLEAKPLVQVSSDRVIFPATPYSRSDAKSYTVEMPVYSNSIYTVDQYIQTLSSYRKRKIDFFAYVNLDDHPEVVFDGDESMRGSNDLIWFKNSGALTNVTPSYDSDTNTARVSLTFFTETYWEPVNRVEYIYQPHMLYAETTTSIPSFISNLPGFISAYPFLEDIQHVERHGKIWAKRNIVNGSNNLNWMLTHTTWDGIVNYRPGNVPYIGRTGSLAIGADDTFEVENSVYSGIATSYYRIALDNGTVRYDTGKFVIQIDSNDDLWQTTTRTVSIDLALLNAALVANGLSGMLYGDVLYFGNWPIQPGFITRAGSIIMMYPYIIYSTDFPGQLMGPQNKVSFGDIGSHPDATLNYLHIFRRE